MTAAGYVLALITIISGLAISDVVISLNRLIRRHRQVRWDWLPLVGAGLATGSIVVSWWFGWQAALDPAYSPTFGFFLLVLLQLIILYLFACAALPDEIPAEGLDLRAYYDANGRYFWGLYAVLAGVFIAKDLVYLGIESAAPDPLVNYLWAGGTLAVAVLLTFVRRRWPHMVFAPLLLALTILPNLDWRLAPAG